MLLRHLVTVAEMAATENPALADKYVLPHGNATGEAFRTLGQKMLEQAHADRELLTKHGLANSLLDDLSQALDAYDATRAESNEGKQDHIGARAALDAASDEVMQLVELLDGLNRYRYGSDRAGAGGFRPLVFPRRPSSQPPSVHARPG